VEQEEKQVRIGVSDQGPGLTEEEQEGLFSEFQALVASPAGDEKSTDLGLAISKKIVDVHDGTIQAENQPEGGTLFYFTLPL
jgi:K+-sensing histidine kinase KdpD